MFAAEILDLFLHFQVCFFSPENLKSLNLIYLE